MIQIILWGGDWAGVKVIVLSVEGTWEFWGSEDVSSIDVDIETPGFDGRSLDWGWGCKLGVKKFLKKLMEWTG